MEDNLSTNPKQQFRFTKDNKNHDNKDTDKKVKNNKENDKNDKEIKDNIDKDRDKYRQTSAQTSAPLVIVLLVKQNSYQLYWRWSAKKLKYQMKKKINFSNNQLGCFENLFGQDWFSQELPVSHFTTEDTTYVY